MIKILLVFNFTAKDNGKKQVNISPDNPSNKTPNISYLINNTQGHQENLRP